MSDQNEQDALREQARQIVAQGHASEKEAAEGIALANALADAEEAGEITRPQGVALMRILVEMQRARRRRN